MTPIVLQDPGSSDVRTITRFELRTAGDYYELGEFLASRFQRWWPPKDVGGAVLSVDQPFAWRAELARVNNNGGVILLARQTSGNNRVIGVAIARATGHPNEAEMYANGGMGEQLEEIMLAALRQECARVGLVIGKEKMVRTWEPV